MATALAIMDRAAFEANTDVIVVADRNRTRLTWIPRDLWCEGLGDRVNQAYRLGGHAALARALSEHGIEIDHSVCARRDAIEAVAAELVVRMPVRERAAFWYPLTPTAPIEEGRKEIVFEPPFEDLTGERIHQWVGARYGVDGAGSDLDRIARQQELVAVLLGDAVDLSRGAANPEAFRASGPEALDELAQVDATWAIATFGPLQPRSIGGREVLVKVPEG
jgi:anionic cell wall polymer biosynthesis LytR-Cps2A-Psr (LCP) family protein